MHAGKGALESVARDLPHVGELAALRAWFEGLDARVAVQRYLGHAKASGQSARGILSSVRRRLAAHARSVGRPELGAIFEIEGADRTVRAQEVASAIATLATVTPRSPHISDEVARWLPKRLAAVLAAQQIRTLADVTVRIPRRRQWWKRIEGLGPTGARRIESFFAAHPTLTERARALSVAEPVSDIVPWERLALRQQLDGSNGSYRAPVETCTLAARNDLQAVSAWLGLHESPATLRAYRKEAERLVLWAVVERARPLSSLTAEDATAYRAFLRRPTPVSRWVGIPRPRDSAEWRPFAGALTTRSVSYAITVLSAMFRWLVEQRYLVANPFAGIKVRGANSGRSIDVGHAFTEAEWNLIRVVADGLEWSYGWSKDAAHRMRFLLDFCYATGLRVSEFLGATLGDIERDDHGDDWLRVIGKGARSGQVALPPMALEALDQYFLARQLPTTRARWDPGMPILGRLDHRAGSTLTPTRMSAMTRKFFDTAAAVLDTTNPRLADKLKRATPHWMRHTHATHALALGADLTTVRDNLRHASIATTSIYLHGDAATRMRQMRKAFVSRR